MYTSVIKRVLPFTLTLIIGAALGNLVSAVFSRTSSSPNVSAPSARTYKSRGCRSRRRERVEANTLTFGNDRIFRSEELEQRAVLLSKPQPNFTEAARMNNGSGTVRLRVVLGANGDVSNITVISGLPDGLTEQAVEAARGIRFMPAWKDGRRVSQYVPVEYIFNVY
ncbi:MAG: energy transducer TonB [Pyrinomonadaceae bacterium]|nr:energy transducer TonB [Pyrinomonadaceae bacterium]